MPNAEERDQFESKGAVESDRPGEPTNTDHLRGQNEHRPNDGTENAYDTDFPEPGSTPEYSMQKQDPKPNQKQEIEPDSKLHPKNDPDGNAEGQLNEQDPGETQKRNQNDKKNDDLAA